MDIKLINKRILYEKKIPKKRTSSHDSERNYKNQRGIPLSSVTRAPTLRS